MKKYMEPVTTVIFLESEVILTTSPVNVQIYRDEEYPVSEAQ